jgi:hypothetical protein
MSIDELKAYYYDRFIPAYADAVASLGDKPVQLLIEQENSLAHIMAHFNSEDKNSNLPKAKAHLERATLDCYKIVWIYYKEKLEYFIKLDNTNLALAFNKEESEVLDKIKNIDRLAKEARELESINIGKNSDLALQKYMEVVELEKSLLESVDIKKASSYNRFRFSHILKDQALGIVLGILTGLLSSYLWERFFH